MGQAFTPEPIAELDGRAAVVTLTDDGRVVAKSCGHARLERCDARPADAGRAVRSTADDVDDPHGCGCHGRPDARPVHARRHLRFGSVAAIPSEAVTAGAAWLVEESSDHASGH